MAFSKHKPRRGPLRRVSDQRRGLALAGLAVGSVFSAALFRRKRGGEEAQPESTVRFEGPAAAAQPEPEAPAAQPESGPPPAVDAPPPASEPELEEAPRPINAAPDTAGVAAAKHVPRPAPLEPATGELSAEEAAILAVLAQSGRSDEDRTAVAIAGAVGRETDAVTDVLGKLDAEGVVSGGAPTASGEETWAVTERGVRRLGAQS